MLEIDESRLLDQLEAAVAASLLAESYERVGQFRFAHALINQTLYEGLGRHPPCAHAPACCPGARGPLRRGPGRAPRRSSRFTGAWLPCRSTRPRQPTTRFRAGQRALESLAPAEALKLFADAVELIGDVDSAERCEALIGLGEAQLQTGEAAYRETLLDAARIASALADAELAARAALANNRGGVSSTFGEIDAERLAAIDRAIELDDPPNRARRARLLALKALELEWDPDFGMRRALAEEAISLARATEDTRTLAEVLRNVARDDPSTGYARLANRSCRGARWLRRRGGRSCPPILGAQLRVSHLLRAGGPRARKARTRAAAADRARARPAHDQLVRHVHHGRLGAHARRSGRRRAPIRERVADRAGGRTTRRRLCLRRRAAASAYLSRPRARGHRDDRAERERLSGDRGLASRTGVDACAISIEEPRPRRSSSRLRVTASSTSRRTRPR